jgi:glyoxylase-like metal-dependent hydrolase (beta-lactamase superfamily II)
MRVSDEQRVEVAPGHPEVVRILAPNPGPMTLEGTNTYLFGADPCWVIDPGPDDPAHLDRVRAEAGARGGVGGVLVTHSHGDHTGGVERLGFEPERPIDGERFGGLTAVATPGHAADHFVFMSGEGICFSGDLVLGSGSSFVPPDGGSLGAYMASLVRVRSLAPTLICPGHGPWVTDPTGKLDEYIEHRESRERGLLEAIGAGERSRTALLARVWSDVPEELRPAAALVMEAHVEKLFAEGRIEGDLDE